MNVKRRLSLLVELKLILTLTVNVQEIEWMFIGTWYYRKKDSNKFSIIKENFYKQVITLLKKDK